MASKKHLEILLRGVEVWNRWREANPKIRPDLRETGLGVHHVGGILIGSVSLRGADLYCASLHGANLSRADLRDADLYRADLLSADLRGADLRGADLSGANLSGANLSGATLRGANLNGANLNRANLNVANLNVANLNGANLNRANFNRADLSGADLRGADLSYSRLSNCKFHKANLIGSNLSRADISKADFVNAAFDPASNNHYLDLATCIGLESAVFSHPDFFIDYLSKSFEFIHENKETESPFLIATALHRLRALRRLYPDSKTPPPPEIVDLTSEISAEIIKYLKRHPEALYKIQPRQFEELIAEILVSYGWEVQLTKATRDGGYDLFAISKDKTGVKTSWIIECKKNRQDRKVGIDVARALYGVKTDLKVASMMLATTSYFSSEVHKYKASRYDLELRDYEGVLEWLNEYKPNPNGRLYIKDNRLVVPGEEE